MTRALQEEKEQLIEYRRSVASLVGRAKAVVQLRPRSTDTPLGAATPIRAICDYRQIEVRTHTHTHTHTHTITHTISHTTTHTHQHTRRHHHTHTPHTHTPTHTITYTHHHAHSHHHTTKIKGSLQKLNEQPCSVKMSRRFPVLLDTLMLFVLGEFVSQTTAVLMSFRCTN